MLGQLEIPLLLAVFWEMASLGQCCEALVHLAVCGSTPPAAVCSSPFIPAALSSPSPSGCSCWCWFCADLCWLPTGFWHSYTNGPTGPFHLGHGECNPLGLGLGSPGKWGGSAWFWVRSWQQDSWPAPGQFPWQALESCLWCAFGREACC